MPPLFFSSRSRSPSPFFSLCFAGLSPTFSFSLSFSCSVFQICGHDNLSKLNNLDNTDTETISAFRFRLYWLFTSALQDASGYAISRQNNLELHLGYHTCWLSYFTLVCLWCGRTVGGRSVYSHVITKFYGMGRFTYAWCSAAACFARERAPHWYPFQWRILRSLIWTLRSQWTQEASGGRRLGRLPKRKIWLHIKN